MLGRSDGQRIFLHKASSMKQQSLATCINSAVPGLAEFSGRLHSSSISSSESSHLSYRHHVDAAGFDTAYLSNFSFFFSLFFWLKDRRLPCDPSLFLSNDTQPWFG